MPVSRVRGSSKTTRPRHRTAGFTLLELMIVVAVVAILSAVAYPAYTQYIVKTHRASAASCLTQYATYMERYYTTNMRYDKDSDGNDNVLPDLNCEAQTADNYSYQFQDGSLAATTFVLQAVPQNAQETRDKECATLSLDQTGQRGVSGTSTVEQCWR